LESKDETKRALLKDCKVTLDDLEKAQRHPPDHAEAIDRADKGNSTGIRAESAREEMNASPRCVRNPFQAQATDITSRWRAAPPKSTEVPDTFAQSA
jgi:hypothetical protein